MLTPNKTNVRRSILTALGLGAIGLFLTGCSWTDARGTHHLIVGIGFGVVTSTNRPGVDVRDSRVLGVMAGPDGAGAGWMHHHRVAIDPALASNVVVSVKATPFSLTVKNFDPYSADPNLHPAMKGNQQDP